MEGYLKNWRGAFLLSLLFLNIIVYAALAETRKSNDLEVHFLDVGQGDAILIESPSGGRVLIDGGPDRDVLSGIGKELAFWDRKIDVVILTHPDKDHIGGLPEVLERYKVGALIHSGTVSEGALLDKLMKRAQMKAVPTLIAKEGMVIDFGDGAKITVLFPDRDVSRWETNDASIVSELTYGESEFLFMGDAEYLTEDILSRTKSSLIGTDVLKVGHHGSKTSTSRAFARLLTPEIAIISAGKDNQYGHPHREVIETLNEVGAKMYSTADMGKITLESDGKEIVVK